MNPYLMYQLYQIERVKTRDEVIEANARLGEIAAASWRLRRDLAGLARLSRLSRMPRLTGRPAPHARPGAQPGPRAA
jgi:hypothetical protein